MYTELKKFQSCTAYKQHGHAQKHTIKEHRNVDCGSG